MWAAHAAWASFGVIAFCQTQPARLSEEAHDCKCHKFSHHTVVDRRILIKLCWLGQCATHMITHVITSQQLGGYTERTFPAAIDGHRVNQVTFTKFILRIIGISFLFEPWNRAMSWPFDSIQERPTYLDTNDVQMLLHIIRSIHTEHQKFRENIQGNF